MQTPVDVEPRRRLAIPTATAIGLLGLGIAFDVAADVELPGVSVPLFVLLVAFSMRAFLPRAPETDGLLAGAFLFSVFPAIHSTLPIIALDMLASGTLLALAATRGDESILRATIASLLRRALHFIESGLRVPAAALTTIARGTRRVEPSRARSALRIAAIAAPILIVFAALLASADRVFGRLLVPSISFPDLTGVARHVAFAIAGAAGAAVFWLASRRSPVLHGEPDGHDRIAPLRFAEWIVVLVGIDILFAIFDGVQFAVLFGGNQHVQVTRGLTYADYARSGFFQLIAVTLLTILVMLATWDLGRRDDARQRRAFTWSIAAMVALSGVILASALVRLTLYQQAFGFTLNRLAAYAGILWIGSVLVGVLFAIVKRARDRVVPILLGTALIVLLGVNAIEPGRFVAQRNAARFASTGKLDATYLDILGPDAIPITITLLPRLPKTDAVTVRASLCDQAALLARWTDPRAANLARARARAALARAGITPLTCRVVTTR